jgi:hypothetical protein
MGNNIITNAEKTYELAMADPNIIKALINVIIAGTIIGLANYIYTGAIENIVLGIGGNLLNWIVLTLTLWMLYIMFKKKKMGDLEFSQIGSALGKLWILIIASNIIILIGMIALTAGALVGVLGLLMLIILIVIGAVTLYSHYKLIKVMFLANKGRHIIVWFLSIVVSGLFTSVILLFF